MGTKCTVIKAEIARPLVGHTIKPFHFRDMTREVDEAVAAAHAEIENARREATRILEEARAQAAAIRKTAREEGLQQGFKEGRASGEQAGREEAFEAAREEFATQQASLIESFSQTINTIDETKAAWNAAARQDLVDLAMAIARRVVFHVGERDRQVVLANLEESARIVGTRTDVTIVVNPADEEAARSFAGTLVELREHWEHVRVVAEPDVPAGGCRVQWATGSLDSRLETQLDRIAQELQSLRQLESESPDEVSGR